MSNATIFEQMRDKYLSRVDEFYAKVRKRIVELDPSAEFSKEVVTLNEELVAPYQARILIINRPTYKPVRLIPRRAWFIGAKGCVDMKSDLGIETLVYVSEGGPAIRIDMFAENGKILKKSEIHPIENDVAKGWVFVQNRQIGMLPSLDADLLYRLLEVLGK